MRYPWNLQYWKSGEWQVVNERLHDMEKAHVPYNPSRVDLFKVLRCIKAEDVKVAIIGQDPYPDLRFATGIAFSVPKSFEIKDLPPTLNAILQEYSSDTGYAIPSHGDLTQWTQRGVLLWNAISSCESGKSLSHDWDEWSYLTKEIITLLSSKGGIVFAFLGAVARRYVEGVDPTKNHILVTSHPSPRGSLSSKTPFKASKIFSRINAALVDMGQDPVKWELKDESVSEAPVQGSNLV